MAVPFDTPTTATQQGPTDYGSQLDEMMAPYRAIAQRFQSPYSTMGPSGALQDAHPMLAHILDNVMLTGAMTPGPKGPEGAGEGISRTFQGLLGAQQYRRQQQMTQMMMPYQMMQPRLQAEKELAETQMYGEHAKYFAALPGIQQERADVMQQRADLESEKGKAIFDDQGRPWRQVPGGLQPDKNVWDPSKDTREPTFQQHVQRTGGGYKPTEAERYAGGQSYRDYTAQETIAGRAPVSEATFNARLTGFAGLRAGAGEAGRLGVSTPVAQQTKFEQEQFASRHDLIQKPPTGIALYDHYDDKKDKGDIANTANRLQQEYQDNVRQNDKAWVNYRNYLRKLGPTEEPIGFHEWSNQTPDTQKYKAPSSGKKSLPF